MGLGHCFLCHRLWVKYPNVTNAILTRDTIIEFIFMRSMTDGNEPSERRLMYIDWLAVIGPCIPSHGYGANPDIIWAKQVENNFGR